MSPKRNGPRIGVSEKIKRAVSTVFSGNKENSDQIIDTFVDYLLRSQCTGYVNGKVEGEVDYDTSTKVLSNQCVTLRNPQVTESDVPEPGRSGDSQNASSANPNLIHRGDRLTSSPAKKVGATPSSSDGYTDNSKEQVMPSAEKTLTRGQHLLKNTSHELKKYSPTALDARIERREEFRGRQSPPAHYQPSISGSPRQKRRTRSRTPSRRRSYSKSSNLSMRRVVIRHAEAAPVVALDRRDDRISHQGDLIETRRGEEGLGVARARGEALGAVGDHRNPRAEGEAAVARDRAEALSAVGDHKNLRAEGAAAVARDRAEAIDGVDNRSRSSGGNGVVKDEGVSLSW
ncbi:hypothetical protein QAD02_008022 [Eretmocerus hayati]|uniref:Uncharacterized protein n=1 Tax=Eretmocerus hayati TaxID=131215 RepID=A0ACC2N9N0_9HYME|nr:hypothetical protein QAD02_008022 [Eretmocerus hayati]